MLRKKDYEAFVRILNESRSLTDVKYKIMDYCTEDNPNFNSYLFWSKLNPNPKDDEIRKRREEDKVRKEEYERIAQILAVNQVSSDTVDCFLDHFRSDNPKFNEVIFMERLRKEGWKGGNITI